MSFLRWLFGSKAPAPVAEEALPTCGDLDAFEERAIDGHPIARVGHLILTQALNDGARAVLLRERESDFVVLYDTERGREQVMTPPKHILTELLQYLSSAAGCEYSSLLQRSGASASLTYRGSRHTARLKARQAGSLRELDIELTS